jgi:GTPase SAR1 family protein
MEPSDRIREQQGPLKVVVVGPCASGKSTLVERLRAEGYDAYACAQEHSIVPDLWNHLRPDVVIGLRVDFETIRARRGSHWTPALYEAQVERLQGAYAAAGIVIDTNVLGTEEMVRAVAAFLSRNHSA